ncbi:hypothetical protein JNUCC64_14000 [Streptomyces sp. JNUCC 64]
MSGETVVPKRPPDELAVGTLAFDTRRELLGVVMDAAWGPVYLRPPGGGIEWCACREDVRPATVADRIRPALRELNVRSTRGGV